MWRWIKIFWLTSLFFWALGPSSFCHLLGCLPPFLLKFSSRFIVDLFLRPIGLLWRGSSRVELLRRNALDAPNWFLVFFLFQDEIITFSQSKHSTTCLWYLQIKCWISICQKCAYCVRNESFSLDSQKVASFGSCHTKHMTLVDYESRLPYRVPAYHKYIIYIL